MNKKIVQVSFYVSGHVTTEVEIPEDLSIENFEKGLNCDKFATTLFPDGSVIDLSENDVFGFKQIGKVQDCTEADLEYTDFSVEENK